jgi:hypothetical protein
MKKIYLLFVFAAFYGSVHAQNIGMGTNMPDPSAKLDITASDKGLLIPRVNLSATNNQSPIPIATTPAVSLLVYNNVTAGTAPNNVTPGYYYWDGTKWVKLGSNVQANNGLSMSGDTVQLGGALIKPTVVSGLTAINQMSFTGTGVNAFNVDGTSLSVDATNHRVGVGTAAPIEQLEVNGNQYNSGFMIANGLVIQDMEVNRNNSYNGPDNSYHTQECTSGYVVTNLSIYATGSYMDGGEEIICVKIGDLITTTHTWRGLEGFLSTKGGACTSANDVSNNTKNYGMNNQWHSASCMQGENEVMTGFEAWSSSELDACLKIRCSKLKTGYVLAQDNFTPSGVVINRVTPIDKKMLGVKSSPSSNGLDNAPHSVSCPFGTFPTAIAVYVGDKFDDGLTFFCSGIKKL